MMITRLSQLFSNRKKSASYGLLAVLAALTANELNAQNVGIGTDTPTEKLEVQGNVKLAGGGEVILENSHVKGLNTLEGFNGIFLQPSPSSNSLIEYDTTGNLILTNQYFNPSIFGVHALRGTPNGLHLQGDANSSSDLFIHPNGKVGIGNIINPTEMLHVNGNALVNGNILLSNATNNPNIFGVNALRGTTNGLHLQGDANSNSDLFVHPNGRVGIGNVPIPTASLEVNGGIFARERLGVGAIYSNVALNAKSNASDVLIFLAEGATGVHVLEVQNDAEVAVIGNFFVTNGSKNFLMDHPLDPANKTLRHSCIESNEVLNIYSGTVILDAQGHATVALPDYFEALNKDFRYQLTCIGGYSQVFIEQEVNGNQFKIAGGTPGLKVSWEVSGVRNDPWMRDHPYQSVMEKTGDEKGRYYYPEGYGQPAEKSLARRKESASENN